MFLKFNFLYNAAEVFSLLSLNSKLIPGIKKKTYKRISNSVSLLPELFKTRHRVKTCDRKGCVIRPLNLLRKCEVLKKNKEPYQENSDKIAVHQTGLFSLIFFDMQVISLCPFGICSYSDYRYKWLNREY